MLRIHIEMAIRRHGLAAAAALLVTGTMSVAQEPPPVADPTVAALASLGAAQPEQRMAALRELGRGDATGPVLEAVALALGDPELEVRRAAVGALLALREDLRSLRPTLSTIVGAPRPGPKGLRFVVLGGPRLVTIPAQPPAGLGAEDARVRRRAVLALCACGTAAAEYEEQILALLGDPDADVRAAVAKNVGSIGWNEGIRDAVIGALKDAAASVRHGAAEGLGGNSNDPAAVAALRSAVQDPDVDVRARVLQSLGHSGQAGAAATADVTASLRDREAKVRVAALDAVAELRIRSDRAVRESIRCLDDGDHKVLLAAIRAVGAQQQAASAAGKRLLVLCNHVRPELRRRALAADWAVADAARRGAVVLRSVEALLDRDREVIGSARELLEQFVHRR